MQLNKHHRESLLNELVKAKADRETQRQCFYKNEGQELAHWFEIGEFLATTRIKLIENSLIDNDIDY